MAKDDKTTEEAEIPAVTVEETGSMGAEVAVEETPSEPVAEAPVAEKIPAIKSASTPKQRRDARSAARLAESGARPERAPEARQAERDELRKQKAVARQRERGQARAKYQSSEHERVPTPPREHVVGLQKTRQGIVTSDKAAKTITVRIDVARPHRKYKKIIRTSMTLHAHDELDNAHIGDTVVVQESRPLSATKRWRLVEVVERAR
jgi:small subunit ribosomal protein S17